MLSCIQRFRNKSRILYLKGLASTSARKVFRFRGNRRILITLRLFSLVACQSRWLERESMISEVKNFLITNEKGRQKLARVDKLGEKYIVWFWEIDYLAMISHSRAWRRYRIPRCFHNFTKSTKKLLFSQPHTAATYCNGLSHANYYATTVILNLNIILKTWIMILFFRKFDFMKLTFFKWLFFLRFEIKFLHKLKNSYSAGNMIRKRS